MAEAKIRVVVAGAPFALQQRQPDGRWLTPEQFARIEAVSPRIELLHTSRDELATGYTPEGAEVLLIESAGADPELDDLIQVVRSIDFRRLVTPRLRWLMSCSSGVEHILPAVDASVTITNSSGVHSNTLAECVLAGVLTHAKRLRERLAFQHQRKWEVLNCTELVDKTFCIIGTGDIGAATARLAHAFGMNVVGVRRTPQPTPEFDQVIGPQDLLTVLPRADFVLIACPLTRETENLIGEQELGAMKKGAYLINVARGKIVNEAALISSLQSGHLGGAYLDAHVHEPQPADHPFWSMPTVTLIPHDSHSSERIGDNTVDLFCDNLERYVAGEPLRNVIRRDLGY